MAPHFLLSSFTFSPLLPHPAAPFSRLRSIAAAVRGPPRPAGRPPVSLRGAGQINSPHPIYMGLTTFPVMKYSQVTGSLRNDGGQSIAFQQVIFFPFRRPCLSC